jgi:MscS family membrane protein
MKNITSLILFIFISIFSFSQNEPKVDLSNPNATIYTHLYFLQPDSYEPEKAATTIYGYKGEAAIDKAIKLKKILDGKGLYVDFTKVPNNPKFSDTTAYKIGNRYTLFPVRMPQISVEKYGNNWLYSRETIAIIDNLYNETFPWQTAWLQNAIPKYGNNSFFGIKIWQYFGLLLFLILALVSYKILSKLIFYLLRKIQYLVTKTSSDRIKLPLKKLNRPLVLLILVYFIKKTLPTLQLGLEVNKFLFLVLNIAQIVFWIYVFLKLIGVVMTIYSEHTKRTHAKLDDQLVPILTHFLTGIVFFLGALKLLTLFGIPAASVLAGASIGGLALALASQDTVKNLIGTFMIFLDKPFHIGDWIETTNIKGTVEEVGFRSTRIRAADTSIYQIPNSTLSEIVVNNKGLRLFRRYQTELGVRYDTPPELIETFVNGIKDLIRVHPNSKKDGFDVAFIGFGDSALNILVNVYFNVNDWSVEQQAKHDFHIAILKLAKVLSIEFAFPSSTLMIEQFPEKQTFNIAYKENFDKEQIKNILNDLKNAETFKVDNLDPLADD